MDDPVVDALLGLFPHVTPEHLPAPGGAAAAAAVAPAHTATLVNPTATPIFVEDRVRRMVRLALLSSQAVILVGPPGTGKTRILLEEIEYLRAESDSYGFQTPIPPPKIVTPDESWTAADLVGGETVVPGGELRFRPGRVLDALAENRWLVLDEANRGDMDKIFGALLTWLSDQEVELGKVSKHGGSPVVTVGWHDGPDCVVEHAATLDDPAPQGDPVRYLAGTEWRLLGTYNGLDAQRVFRFGHALGRRFARVPVPAPPVDLFRLGIEPHCVGLPAGVLEAVVGLYAAHLERDATRLGPGLFVRIPTYVRAGLTAAADGVLEIEVPPAADAPPDGEAETEAAPEPDDAAPLELLPRSASALVAEGYLVNVGTWLARLEEHELEAVGARIVTRGALSADDWVWIGKLARDLG
jgi:hypothetical protein